MTASVRDRATILQTIRAWPRDEQLALAEEILRQADQAIGDGPVRREPQRPSWKELAGLAANGQEPPSDEQVEQWLDERRMEKYGR